MMPVADPGLPEMFAAFTAGLLSFLSPCVLPLVPAWLSFISGETAADLRAGNASRPAVLARTLLFTGGFSLVFVALAVIFGGGMRFVGSAARTLAGRAAGIVVIVLAVNTVFDFLPFLRLERRVHPANGSKGSPRAGLKAVILGMAFAAGWSPCIGPILSSILLYAGRSGTIAGASGLLVLYSLGLALPFILAASFLDRALPVLGSLKRHQKAVRILSGVLLAGFGLSMLSGSFSGLSATLQKAGYGLGELAARGPAWLLPAAEFAARWLSFRGI